MNMKEALEKFFNDDEIKIIIIKLNSSQIENGFANIQNLINNSKDLPIREAESLFRDLSKLSENSINVTRTYEKLKALCIKYRLKRDDFNREQEDLGICEPSADPDSLLVAEIKKNLAETKEALDAIPGEFAEQTGTLKDYYKTQVKEQNQEGKSDPRDKKIAELEEQNAALTKENEDLRSNLSAARDTVSTLTQQNIELKRALATSMSKIAQLQSGMRQQVASPSQQNRK